MTKKIYIPTHSEGCQISAKYLQTKMNCGAVFIEPCPLDNKESPDAIGFRAGGCSILMEVKVSRSDFLSDRKKPHRMNPETGMGDYRFYVCPEGMIRPDELPPKWGLFYFTQRKSLKPVVVPDVQMSSLYSPQHYAKYLAEKAPRYQASPFGVPPYILGYQELLKHFAHFQKNNLAEHNIFYGAWRQLCIAQKNNLDYTVTEIFQRPAI